MIVQGNDRILFIKRGDNFQPVGCLTSNGIDESTEFLPTTTRNANGWETQRPTNQNYTINFEGLQVPTAFRSDSDFIKFWTFTLTLDLNIEGKIRFRLNEILGWFVIVRKVLVLTQSEVNLLPSTNVLIGATIADTIDNIIENLNIYNINSNLTYERVGNSLVVTILNDGNYTATSLLAASNEDTEGISVQIGTFNLSFETILNPNPINLASVDV